jgi:hypothetical protein
MPRPNILLPLLLVLAVTTAQVPRPRAGTVTFGTLLQEMTDLAELARLPAPSFQTVQFSSYDRRSTSPDAAGWFSNADGFGREPIPGFLKVLRAPAGESAGEYLLAEVTGPGAVVRTWSAGMGGVLRVWLDGSKQPLYQGDAYRFLARKSEVFLEGIDLGLERGDAFVQQDADYLPIPFRRSLRVTWEGDLNALHFYHFEVRRYAARTRVVTFDPAKDPTGFREELRGAVRGLTAPGVPAVGDTYERSADLEDGISWDLALTSTGTQGAITRLSLRITAADPWRALRGTLLQIAFDGAERPQVEAPAGDFFGSGPGVNPFDSLPMTVASDGTMTCRFTMPFREKALVRLTNRSGARVHIETVVQVSPWNWDERSLYFRARWRSGRDLDPALGPVDLPFLLLQGQGRLVGAASILVNPSATPTSGGNWWGEGDEKIFVDAGPFPAFYGTGTEDYYNYSWSRPDLFDHPYCGQPLDTGPGNIGYVSNHRWHILDSVPFTDHLAFFIELWHHQAFPGLCYDRIAFAYARPGAVDDHLRIQRKELTVPVLPANLPQPLGGARNATFYPLEAAALLVAGGQAIPAPAQPGASRGQLFGWRAEAGDRLEVPVTLPEAGDYTVNLVAAHWPESGSLRVSWDGEPLIVDNLGGAGEGERGEPLLVLKSGYARRLLSTGFRRGPLEAGTHRLVITCTEGGTFGFDYLWIRKN